MTLLERHGQGGNCGFAHKLYYHNSFLIADPHDAWVFETAGRHWAARQIQGVYAISNAITLGSQWDLASPGLVANAVRRGLCKDAARVRLCPLLLGFPLHPLQRQPERCALTSHLLQAQAGRATPLTLMSALRQHEPEAAADWSPARGLLGSTVCMHAGYGPARGSQTTGSLVAHLHPERPTLFVTGTAAPCTSLFKPLWLDTPLPDPQPTPVGTYDPQTLFWRHERLHRAVLRDYPARTRLPDGRTRPHGRGFCRCGADLRGQAGSRAHPIRGRLLGGGRGCRRTLAGQVSPFRRAAAARCSTSAPGPVSTARRPACQSIAADRNERELPQCPAHAHPCCPL